MVAFQLSNSMHANSKCEYLAVRRENALLIPLQNKFGGTAFIRGDRFLLHAEIFTVDDEGTSVLGSWCIVKHFKEMLAKNV